MLNEFTEREKTIAAAAYLRGLALGLAMDRSKSWYQKAARSKLGDDANAVFGTVGEIMTDGCASNPLLIYEMQSLAEKCGMFAPIDQARARIAFHLAPAVKEPVT